MAAITSQKSRSSSDFNPSRMMLSLLLMAGTAAFIYFGFVFFRDNSIQQDIGMKAAVSLAAIVWGVGGMALAFYVFDMFIESLPLSVRKWVQPYFFVGPALLLLTFFLAYPGLRTLIMSFYDNDRGETFVGLANYVAFIEPDNVMLQAFRNNVLWIVFGASFSIIIGLLVAVLADRSSFERAAKSLIFMPMAISFIGAAVIWRFIYEVRPIDQPQIGLLNAIVKALGFKPQAWTTSIWINELYANVPPWLGWIDGRLDWVNNLFLIVIVVWLQTGFAMVLFSAALKGIPSELIEAARVDGATEIQIFFRIMIPYIRGTIVTVSTTIIIFTLKVFDVVWAMTGGNFETEVIGTQFFRQNFVLRNQGYGAAIAIVLLIAVIPVMIYNLRQFRENKAF